MQPKRNVNEIATGRWPNILAHFGIAESFLTGKHGPCPICGGKDRFRFGNKERQMFGRKIGFDMGADFFKSLLDAGPLGQSSGDSQQQGTAGIRIHRGHAQLLG